MTQECVRNSCKFLTHIHIFILPCACTHRPPVLGGHDRCSSAPRRYTFDRENTPRTSPFRRGIINWFVITLSRELFLGLLILLENQEYCEWKYEYAGDRGEPYRTICYRPYQYCTNQITIPREIARLYNTFQLYCMARDASLLSLTSKRKYDVISVYM